VYQHKYKFYYYATLKINVKRIKGC